MSLEKDVARFIQSALEQKDKEIAELNRRLDMAFERRDEADEMHRVCVEFVSKLLTHVGKNLDDVNILRMPDLFSLTFEDGKVQELTVYTMDDDGKRVTRTIFDNRSYYEG